MKVHRSVVMLASLLFLACSRNELEVAPAAVPQAEEARMVMAPPLQVRLWLSAYIPRTIAGYTRTIGSGPHSGKTVIPAPQPAPFTTCFLTAHRAFESNPTAKHRMQSALAIDLVGGALISHVAHSDATIEVDCSTGAEKCNRVADTNRIVARNFSKTVEPNGRRRYFFTLAAAGSNPCVTPSPDIDWLLPVIVEHDPVAQTVNMTVDGMIEPFPAFEMYATFQAAAPTVIFQESPVPGATPWNLP